MNRETIIRTLIILAVVVGIGFVGWRFVDKRTKKQSNVAEIQQRLDLLVNQHNAVTNWLDIFDFEDLKIGESYRSVYTSDIRGAVMRDDGRPVLVIGEIFEVDKHADIATIGVKVLDGYPDLNFVLDCTPVDADVVLKQPTDNGGYFAVIASVTSVSRPGFELDTGVEYDGDDAYAEIIVEPGDQYILRGNCLGITYIEDYLPD